MVYDLANALARAGVRVSVIACHDLYGPPLCEGQRSGNLRVYWAASPTFKGSGVLARSLQYIVFSLAALARSLRCRGVDIVVCLTTPPLLGFLALLRKGLAKSKFVLWEMDLYPHALVAAGWAPDRNPVIRFLHWLSARILRSADHIVSLGPYQKSLIEACGAGTPVSIIPPWDDREIPRVNRRSNRFLAAYGLLGKKIILYAGNLGRGHSFSEILEVCRRWRHRTDVSFLFVGQGAAFPEIRSFQEREQLANLLLLEYQPASWLGDLLSSADVHLISMRPGWQGIIVPSKLFGILKVSGAVGFVGPLECETAAAIRDGGFGFLVECGEVDALEQHLTECLFNPSLLEAYRRAAENYHLRHAAPALAYRQWFRLLSGLQPPDCRPIGDMGEADVRSGGDAAGPHGNASH